MSREVIGSDATTSAAPDEAPSGARQAEPLTPPLPRPGRQRLRAALGGLVAGAAVGALVTATVVERRYEQRALESVRLVTSLQYLPHSPVPGPQEDVNLSLSVLSTAGIPVRIVDVDFSENVGSTLTLRQAVRVEPGVTARVPVRARLNCAQLVTSDITFRVETDDGRSRLVEAAGILDDAAPQMADLAYLCSG